MHFRPYTDIPLSDNQKRPLDTIDNACHSSSECPSAHHRHSNRRRLLVILPAVLSLITLLALLAFACMTESGMSVLRDAGLDGLLRRDTSSSPFTNHKCKHVFVPPPRI